MNIGEELVAAYLQHIKGCDFTQQNLYTLDVQGEIDVVGISLAKPRSIYICEVAIHLATGLRYTKGSKSNNVAKLTEKFSRDIKFARKYFPGYKKHFMLWSPIIKKSRAGAVSNQERDLQKIIKNIKSKYKVSIELIVNDKFQAKLTELRKYAGSKTEELKNPVLRLFQIEQALEKHLAKKPKGSNQ